MALGAGAATQIDAVNKVAGTGAQKVATPKAPEPVAISDEMAFQRALKQPSQQSQPTANDTMGTKAVASLQDMKSSFAESVQRIKGIFNTNGAEMDPKRMLQAELELTHLYIRTDFTNKIASGVNEKTQMLLNAN